MPRVVTVDDVCLAYLPNFIWFDRVRAVRPDFWVLAFAIGTFHNEERLATSSVFCAWWEARRDWVEIAVHASDHLYPPDGDRDDERYWIVRARESLRPFLPARYGYRSPGWQTTCRTVPILRELGFDYVAYESHIRDLATGLPRAGRVVNSHLYDSAELERLFHRETECVI